MKPQERDPDGRQPSYPGAKLDAHKRQAGSILSHFSGALEALVAVGDFGAQKYSLHGWESVPDGRRRYYDALWRHILAATRETVDPDSGIPHLHHALWNLAAIIEMDSRQ